MEQSEDTEREVPPKRAPKTFVQTLQDHHYGHTADEATAALQEAIDAAERTGKQTEVTVKLTFKPVSKAGRYDVRADVTNKLPPKEREAAIMFVGPDGNLQNNDPRQKDLPGMRVVDKPAPAVRLEDEQRPAGTRVS
jgi:hypothetical protein